MCRRWLRLAIGAWLLCAAATAAVAADGRAHRDPQREMFEAALDATGTAYVELRERLTQDRAQARRVLQQHLNNMDPDNREDWERAIIACAWNFRMAKPEVVRQVEVAIERIDDPKLFEELETLHNPRGAMRDIDPTRVGFDPKLFRQLHKDHGEGLVRLLVEIYWKGAGPRDPKKPSLDQFVAAWALVAIGARTGAIAFERMADESQEARFYAIEFLSRMGTDDAKKALEWLKVKYP